MFSPLRELVRRYPHKASIIFLLVVVSLLGLASPLIYGALLDALHAGASLRHVLALAVASVVVGVVSLLVGYAEGRLRVIAGAACDCGFRAYVWHHIARLPVQTLHGQSVGVWMRKLSNDAGLVCETFQMLVFGLLGFAVFFIGTAVIVFFKTPAMIFLFLLILLVGWLIHRLFERRITCSAKKLREGFYHFHTYVFDLVMMLPLLRTFGLMDLFHREFDRQNGSIKRRRVRSQILDSYYGTLLSLEMAVTHGIVLVACILLYHRGLIALGDIIAYDMLLTQLATGVSSLLQMLPRLDQGLDSARALKETFALPEEPPAIPVSVSHPGVLVQLDHVSFRYDRARVETLHDVSFEIGPGDFVCLLGRNGAGKSTLVNLVLGVLRPTSGTIARGFLRPALVPQRLRIFRASLLENVRLHDTSISEAKVLEVLALCDLDALLRGGPDGLFHEIHAEQVSGGELQRLAIARALVRDPDLLVVDEVSNNLDLVERVRVQELLESLKGRCAVISISHDPDALRRCRRILVVSDGRVREMSDAADALAAIRTGR